MGRFALQSTANVASRPEGRLTSQFARHELLAAVIAGLDHAEDPGRVGAQLSPKVRPANMRRVARRIGLTALNALRQW